MTDAPHSDLLVLPVRMNCLISHSSVWIGQHFICNPLLIFTYQDYYLLSCYSIGHAALVSVYICYGIHSPRSNVVIESFFQILALPHLSYRTLSN